MENKGALSLYLIFFKNNQSKIKNCTAKHTKQQGRKSNVQGWKK